MLAKRMGKSVRDRRIKWYCVKFWARCWVKTGVRFCEGLGERLGERFGESLREKSGNTFGEKLENRSGER